MSSEGTGFLDGRVILHGGDSRELVKALAAGSIDAVVTDPPYALVSIVKRFGKNGAAPAKGNDAYTRASAGFMGKQWDTGELAFDPAFWADVLAAMKPGAHLVAFSGTRSYHRLACAIEDAGFEIRDQLAWVYGSGFPKSHDVAKAINKAAGESMPEVQAWQGWGTALKPAWEPIVLARKPLGGSVAGNVLEYGTGALNIDGCRVEASEDTGRPCGVSALGQSSGWNTHNNCVGLNGGGSPAGRWPANVVHDGSEDVLAGFPDTASGQLLTHHKRAGKTKIGTFDIRDRTGEECNWGGDSGSAARFFYTAKADAEDRLGSKHPTVKPVDLMQWLVRLICPKGGTVLDPFAGTGTTGEAAWREGCRAVLFEREEEYHADIARRMELALAPPRARKAHIAARRAEAEAAKNPGVVIVDEIGGLFGDQIFREEN